MKKTILFLFAFYFSFAVFAQKKDTMGSKHYPFVSYYDHTIQKPLKEGRYLTVHLLTDSASSYTYSGIIFVGDTNSLLMIGGTEEYHGYTDAGATFEERYTTNPDDEVTVIPHKEIEYISLTPRLKPVFGTLAGLSLVVICVTVPLASVGYTSKNFNPTKIVEVAAVSLAANVALYKIFKVRKFRIRGSKPPIAYKAY
jgi:hypothetical protein